MNEKHTPLPWAAEEYSDHEGGIGILGVRDGGTNPSNGLVAWVTLLPTEMDTKDPSRAQANAALIVRSVNALPDLVKALEEIAERADIAAIADLARDALAKVKQP